MQTEQQCPAAMRPCQISRMMNSAEGVAISRTNAALGELWVTRDVLHGRVITFNRIGIRSSSAEELAAVFRNAGWGVDVHGDGFIFRLSADCNGCGSES